MIWTHRYNFLVRLLCVGILVVLMIIYSEYRERHNYEVTGISAPIVMLIGLAIYFLAYELFFRTFGDWLYCRITLGMKITFHQAKKLSTALSPRLFLSGKWLNLKEVLSLPKEQRFPAAMSITTSLSQSQKNEAKKSFAVSGSKKTDQIASIILMVGCLIVAFFNFFPASLITDLFSDNGEYYPMLNFVILLLPTLIAYYLFVPWLRRRFKR